MTRSTVHKLCILYFILMEYIMEQIRLLHCKHISYCPHSIWPYKSDIGADILQNTTNSNIYSTSDCHTCATNKCVNHTAHMWHIFQKHIWGLRALHMKSLASNMSPGTVHFTQHISCYWHISLNMATTLQMLVTLPYNYMGIKTWHCCTCPIKNNDLQHLLCITLACMCQKEMWLSNCTHMPYMQNIWLTHMRYMSI